MYLCFYSLVSFCFPLQVKKDSVVSCVLDSEAVAWDREKQQIQPFQVLTTRKRKVGRGQRREGGDLDVEIVESCRDVRFWRSGKVKEG